RTQRLGEAPGPGHGQLDERELAAAGERQDPRRALRLPREPALRELERDPAPPAAAAAGTRPTGAADRPRPGAGRGPGDGPAARATPHPGALERGEPPRAQALHRRPRRKEGDSRVERRKRGPEPAADPEATRGADRARRKAGGPPAAGRREDHDHEGQPARGGAEDREGDPRAELLPLLPHARALRRRDMDRPGPAPNA